MSKSYFPLGIVKELKKVLGSDGEAGGAGEAQDLSAYAKTEALASLANKADVTKLSKDAEGKLNEILDVLTAIKTAIEANDGNVSGITVPTKAKFK